MNNRISSLLITAIIGIAIFGFASLKYIHQINQETRLEAETELSTELRFQKKEQFVFNYDGRTIKSRAAIYVDTKTGIEYLYIYDGPHARPAITRLWKK